ncbi:MAG: serine/threonine protein kinase [Myxococcales bacterium]|nr:serine/threonine protein kinase [Myxococcales bacterium]
MIGEPLGRGRMGVVFAAHDERLDRQVALKILAGDRSSPAERLRLLGAAQALARLSHPNIVAAHEAGEIDGQIYLSMELVHGVPLPTWLKKQPRRWKEIVRVFIAAGRGLAAAHAAGMVHGDFTPGEVLVGDDGRVRVTDFGLTIAVEASAGEQAELRRSAAHLSLAAVEPAGTPCYMPPERLRGGEADVRGDVFALSVALFEALFGARPFVGRTVSERLSELMSARPILIPPQPRIPTWLDRALRRGLADDPRARFPSVDKMVAAIDPGRHLRRRVLAIAGVGALAVAGGAQLLAWQAASAPCADAREAIASVWGEGHRSALASAFAAAPQSHAEGTWSRLEPRLDAYAASWAEASAEACEAELRGERGDGLHERQLACLDRQRGALRALRDGLAEPDERAISAALRVAAALPKISACADLDALAAAAAPPREPAQVEELAAIEAMIADADTARALGHPGQALELSQQALARAQALDHLPGLARATGSRGLALLAQSGGDDPVPVLTDALWLADAARDDALLAETMSAAMIALADEGRADEARGHRRHADAVILRRGDRSPERQVLLRGLAAAELAAGDADAAIRELDEAVEVAEVVDGAQAPQVADALVALARGLRARVGSGDLERAQEALTRALEIDEASYGADHPELIEVLGELGQTALQRGQAAAGCPHLERALEIALKTIGEDHPTTLGTTIHLSRCLAASDRRDEAAAMMKWGAEIARRVHGETHPQTVKHLLEVAAARAALGDHQAIVDTLGPLAPALREQGEERRGEVIAVERRLAEASLALADHAAAEANATQALALLGAPEAPADRRDTAALRFILARAIAGRGGDADESRAQAEAALAGYRELAEPADADAIAEIEAFLAEAPTSGKKKKKKKKKKPKKKAKKKKK